MGEARRRKLSGTYPKPHDPLDAARRFWCGRGPTAVEDFAVPEGTVAITFDIEGVNPSTCIINPTSMASVLDQITDMARDLSYYPLVRFIAREFVKCRQIGDDGALNWIGFAGLWVAFNHPESGEHMRKAVSEKLRQEGKAHISWHFGSDGLATALAEQFVDLEKLAALAPRDRVTTIVASDGGSGTTTH